MLQIQPLIFFRKIGAAFLLMMLCLLAGLFRQKQRFPLKKLPGAFPDQNEEKTGRMTGPDFPVNSLCGFRFTYPLRT